MRARSAVVLFSVLAAPGVALVAVDSASARPAGRLPAKAKPAAEPVNVSFEKDVHPLVVKYCGACHGQKQQIAGIDFHGFKDEAAALKGRTTWEKAAREVQAGKMPPRNMPQPTAAQKALLISWVGGKLAKADCGLRDPGRVTLRRLNRAEYNNTIRDLAGVDFHPADDFPSDDVGYGFDNIGDVLTISPLLMEKYLAAAEQVAEKAIVADPAPGPVDRAEAKNLPDTAGGMFYENTYRLLGVTGDSLRRVFQFPQDGDYLLRVRAFQQPFGDEPARMGLRLENPQRGAADGVDVATFEVKALEEAPKVYEAKVKLAAGKRLLAAVYLNNARDLDNPDPKKRGDRNLVIDYIEVVGPLPDKPKELPESHKRILFVQPQDGKEREAASRIMERFATRAFRRPVRSEELDRILAVYDLARKEGDGFERGIQLAVEAVLVSPNFLFRVEMDPNPKASAADARPLNDWELASRLSYFLWSTMPDDELMQLAAAGKLHDPDVLEEQAKRMLRDPRAHALVENFADQWLNLRLLKNVSPDPKRYTDWNDALRRSMLKETELFFGSIIRDDRPVTELLDARYTFLDERLAKHYGLDWVKGDYFRKVVLPDDRRGGILTQAGILTITSNPTRTSPVKRGKWVLEQVLGTPPPPPPPNVPPLAEDTAAMMVKGTLKQRMEQHRKDPSCANCHATMDAMGFSLENYDPVGAWRDKDGDETIDASGTTKAGEAVDGIAGLRKMLKKHRSEFVRNFSRQLLTYALGRGLEHYDECVVNDIDGSAARQGSRFSAFVAEIVKSDPFRKRRGEGDVQ